MSLWNFRLFLYMTLSCFFGAFVNKLFQKDMNISQTRVSTKFPRLFLRNFLIFLLVKDFCEFVIKSVVGIVSRLFQEYFTYIEPFFNKRYGNTRAPRGENLISESSRCLFMRQARLEPIAVRDIMIKIQRSYPLGHEEGSQGIKFSMSVWCVLNSFYKLNFPCRFYYKDFGRCKVYFTHSKDFGSYKVYLMYFNDFLAANFILYNQTTLVAAQLISNDFGSCKVYVMQSKDFGSCKVYSCNRRTLESAKFHLYKCLLVATKFASTQILWLRKMVIM